MFLSNESKSLLDLEIEAVQTSIYYDIIKKIIMRHRSISIIKISVFGFVIKKRQCCDGSIYSGHDSTDLVLKFLSQASGLFEELCNQFSYILQAIDLLVKDGICEVHEGELICLSSVDNILNYFDAFTEKAILESKLYSDRQFLREVISIV